MKEVEFKLPAALHQKAEQSGNALVRDIPKIFLDLTRLRNGLNREFRWRETPKEVFDVKLAQLRTADDLNALYWRDMGSTIKVYCLSITWRILELLEQSVLLLHQGAVLGPAIMGRSLIELTSAFILNGGVIREVLSQACKQWGDTVVASEELENLLNKAVFGSRLVPEGHYLRQTNILTQIQKLSRVAGFEEVIRKYEHLCEVAHPNVVGNARFWSDWVRMEPDGTHIRYFRPRTASNDTVDELQDVILWALAWAGANALAGFALINAQVDTIMRKFPSNSDATYPAV
jgi:hypothetical protein